MAEAAVVRVGQAEGQARQHVPAERVEPHPIRQVPRVWAHLDARVAAVADLTDATGGIMFG